MQIAPEQGAFLTLLTRLLGVEPAVEVGTFTGYSSLCIARGLADGGRLVCCDVSEEWTAIGRAVLGAGGGRRPDRPAYRARRSTRSRRFRCAETIDLAFIDADKPNYANYYEELLPRMRAERRAPRRQRAVGRRRRQARTPNDDNTIAIKAFNDKVAADDRVEAVMLPIADGFTLARVK